MFLFVLICYRPKKHTLFFPCLFSLQLDLMEGNLLLGLFFIPMRYCKKTFQSSGFDHSSQYFSSMSNTWYICTTSLPSKRLRRDFSSYNLYILSNAQWLGWKCGMIWCLASVEREVVSCPSHVPVAASPPTCLPFSYWAPLSCLRVETLEILKSLSMF